MTTPLKTVAIADDEPGILDVLQVILADHGYQCVGRARNGAEALELVRTHKPNVLLLDFHMPVQDGMSALPGIVALGTTAVVMLTADSAPEVSRNAMDLGASGYMIKPFESAQIATIIETAWHRFQVVSTLQEKTKALDEALEMRKLTEKAKGILMEQQHFTEEEAHKTLLKMSQDQGIPLKEVCRSVIQVRMVLGKPTRKTHSK